MAINVPTAVINSSLSQVAELMQRLGRIENALQKLESETVSLCHISTKDNRDSVERLLDPHLDEVVDSAVSNAAAESLRTEAQRVINSLAELGFSLDDSITTPLLSGPI